MRNLFGLVGLLAAILVIVMFWMKHHPADTVRQAEPAKKQVEQMAGGSPDMRAKDSITLEPILKDGKLRYVLVDQIVADGPMHKYYGLKRNDSIVATGTMDFKGEDGDMAVDLILRAYQTKDKLIVLRDGKRLELPLDPAHDAPPTRENSSPIHQQLDAIPGIR